VYGWLWNHLPGPLPVRLLVTVVLLFAVVCVLFLWVFPWLEPRLPFTGVTVQDSSGAIVRTLGR
jgi:hypothetical protein